MLIIIFFVLTRLKYYFISIHIALKRQLTSREIRTTFHCWGESNKLTHFGIQVTQNPKSPDLLATLLHVSWKEKMKHESLRNFCPDIDSGGWSVPAAPCLGLFMRASQCGGSPQLTLSQNRDPRSDRWKTQLGKQALGWWSPEEVYVVWGEGRGSWLCLQFGDRFT